MQAILFHAAIINLEGKVQREMEGVKEWIELYLLLGIMKYLQLGAHCCRIY
jgi:hypothetical protein